MTTKSPKKVFVSYENHIKKKAKKIEEFLQQNAGTVNLNARKTQKLQTLPNGLRNQLTHMETAWDEMKEEIAEFTPLVYDEMEEMIDANQEAVDKALSDSDTVLEASEASVQYVEGAAGLAPPCRHNYQECMQAQG